jgi:hypothetical protein
MLCDTKERGRDSWTLDAIIWRRGLIAGMAELADAADSKSAEGNLMGVRFPLPAPNVSDIK